LIKTLQQMVEAANARGAELRQERGDLKEQIDYLRKRLFFVPGEKWKLISTIS
jgi:transposase